MRKLLLAGLLWLFFVPAASAQEAPWSFYRQCCFFMFEHAPPVGNPPANSLYVYAKDVAGVTTFVVKRSDGVEIALVAGGGGGAPTTATYITQTPDAGLSAEQALSALGTGILKSTTGTGVLSIAVAGDFPTLNQSTTGTAAALTVNGGNCAGNNFALGVDAAGVAECAQPAFSNLSGSATDAQIPNTITIDLATLATTASALAANGGNCGGNNFALGVDAAGVGECAQPAFSNLSGAATDAQVPNTITVDLAAAATALAANPADCATSTHFAVGIDASGAAVCEAIADADVPDSITVTTAGNVSGTVAIANGGTGQTGATAAFDALAPTTTQGDVIYHNGTDNVRLAKGSAAQVLTMNAGATAPEWATAGAGSSPTSFVRLAADDARSVTAKNDLSGMSFTLAANTNYSYTCRMFTTANAATVGVQFDVTFGGTLTAAITECQMPGAATTLLWFSDLTAPFSCNPTASQGNIAGFVEITGTLEVSGTGGTLQFQHGSETATLTTVLRGSWCMLMKY